MRAFRHPLVLVSAAAVGLGALLLTRRMTATWGTVDGEHEAVLPGDGLISDAVVATRGVTIATPPSGVWPWIAQLGQGRGGFYSYDALENLMGLDIHSADRIEQRWQEIYVGDPIHLAPEFALEVVDVAPGRHVVLAGPGAHGPGAQGPDGRSAAFTWAFIVLGLPDGRTRLLVRERYARRPMAARVAAELVQPISFVMSARMLRGIRDRAQREAHRG